MRPAHIPRPHQLDGGQLFLPRLERKGDACLTYLPAPDRTVLAWWGSPFDERGAVNSAIITEGNVSAEECWQRFVDQFSDLAQLPKPNLLRGE